MKILPNNIPVGQDLSFRLRLDVQLDSNARFHYIATTNGLRIQDSKDNAENGLDMDFEIERTSGEEPSLATITIWNLSNSTFNQIASKANSFELYYAQGNDDWSLLFRGTPYFTTQEGAVGGNNASRGFLSKDDATGGENDIATHITLIDSLHSFESAVISKSYQGDVSTKKIIDDCVTAMGIEMGDEIDFYPYINNYVARGKCSKVLKEICNKIGCKHIVENGVLHLYNGSRPKLYGYLFNGENSSKPELEQDDETNLTHFVTKLLPNLRAGQYCKCEFDTLNGVKQIDKVLLSGNNYGTVGQAEIWVK